MAWLGESGHGTARQGMAGMVFEINTGNTNMEIDTIRWKSSPKAKLISAQVAYQSLIEIKAANAGALTPDDVVDTAKNPDSPLHSWFTWDDTEAARLQRLTEARSMIRAIEIVYKETPKTSRRAFEITVKKQPGNTLSRTIYSTAEEAATDPESQSRLIAEAIRTLMAWRRRFAGLQELHRLIVEIDRGIASLADATPTATANHISV
jgi:hypothetical protein